ncbi:hypothetical protein SeMB42_g05189, partial [Synchytrium endobioticum]
MQDILGRLLDESTRAGSPQCRVMRLFEGNRHNVDSSAKKAALAVIHINLKQTATSQGTAVMLPIEGLRLLSVGAALGVGLGATAASIPNTGTFSLTVLHTNDIHSHFDPVSPYGSSCSEWNIANNECYGGFARIVTMVKKLRNTAGLNTLLVDAGDQFQGSLFFNVWGGSIIGEAMNMLEYEAMTIGNHEFDKDEEYLADFVRNLTFPVVVSNLDYKTTPHLNKVVKPYVILEKYGQKIGVVGSITNTTAQIATGGRHVTFYDPVVPVQTAINEMKEKGVNKIICLSHNGYTDDQYLAANTFGLNLIIGAHSHSLLHKNRSLAGWEGPYPTVVRNLNGTDTYIVQAHRFGDYLGVVNMTWDARDVLIDLQGDPILLDNTIPADSEMSHLITDWRDAFLQYTSGVVGNVLKPG